MRIALLVRQYAPGVGGLESFVAALARELRVSGHDTTVVTLDRLFASGAKLAAREKIDDVEVVRYPYIGVRRYFAPRIPARDLHAFDIVHVHGIDGLFEYVARTPRPNGQVRLATTHGAFFHTKWMAPVKRAYFDFVTRGQFSGFDALLANSAADEALIAPFHPCVRLIPNGVEPLGPVTHGGSDLLALGRLSTNKRIHLLIEAMAAAALRDAPTHLHIVGPEWDVSATMLKVHAERCGVAGKVTVHGPLAKSDIARLAQKCACFVSASAYEGFGMAMVEAMGAGLIPVVHANASFTELLAYAKLGEITNFEDSAAAALAIMRGLQSARTNQRLAAANFAARYSWPAHAAKTADLYSALLARRRMQTAA